MALGLDHVGTSDQAIPCSGRNVDGDAEVLGDLAEADPDVAGVPKPQLTTVGESRGDRLRDQPAGVAVPGSDLGGLVETRAGIEHLEHLAVWEPQRLPIRVRQRSERLRQLSARRVMDPLQ